MISRRSLGFVVLALVAGASAASAAPPVATEIAIQGVARDASDFVIPSGNLAVRVYADSLGATPLYDSGSTFTGAIQQGLFDVIVGRATPLLLDPGGGRRSHRRTGRSRHHARREPVAGPLPGERLRGRLRHESQ